jgi:chorismate mutase
MNLKQLRAKISRLDISLIRMLARRQALMPAVGAYKKAHKLPIHQAGREKEVLKLLETLAAKKHLDPILARKIFKEIFRNSKAIQRGTRAG